MCNTYLIPAGFKLISGGQSGADRAALDWAIRRELAHGGWCPRGRRAEDGPIDRRYHLIETPAAGYLQRTEWNVRDSDATLIFTLTEALDGGSGKTAELAQRLGKPWRHVHPRVHPKYIASFLVRCGAVIVNVAGKRESQAPGVGAWVSSTLDRVISFEAVAMPGTLEALSA